VIPYEPVKPDYSDIEKAVEYVNEAYRAESSRTGLSTREVSGEEIQEAVRWADGQELQNIVDTRGYGIVISLIHGYMDGYIRDCILTNPANKDEVLQNQCLAHSATHIFERLESDVKSRLVAAESVPEVVKLGIRLARGVPVGSAD
jgi:hypothetical protein